MRKRAMSKDDAVSHWLRRRMIERCDAVQRWFDEHYEEIPRSAFGKLLVKLRLLEKYREIEPPVRTIRVKRYDQR
jgi:hypothetical protein